MVKTELLDYQKGLIDVLAGEVELLIQEGEDEMFIQECEDEIIDILLYKLNLKRT